MPAIYINEALATSMLNMENAISLTEEAFKSNAQGEAFNMVRQRMRIKKGALHMLPAAIPYKNVIGFKAYTSFRTGLIFKVHLYSAETGQPIAIIDANEIGRLRTGAASGVASKYMAKEGSKNLLIFGGGYQAEAQLEAVLATVKTINKVVVSTRSNETAVEFAKLVTQKFSIDAVASKNIGDDLKSADILITVTTSPKPLFDHTMLNPDGVHINAAGSNALIRAEIPEKTVEAAEVLAVDSKDVAAVECGDILPSMEKGRIHWNEIVELGDIISGFRKGRLSQKGITLFESQGMGLQDVICAEHVYRKVLETNSGLPLPF